MKKTLAIAIALLLVFLFSVAFAEEWTCPNCGSLVEGKFCNNCGQKKPTATSEDWVCPACGNNASGNFCSSCGKERPIDGTLLGDMEIFQRKTVGGMDYLYTDSYDKYLKDNYGNEYTHSVSIGKGSLTYLLNHKYITFNGTVACPKGLSSDSFYRASATLKIYGDDELITKFEGFNDGSRPESFSINVKPYERLKLEVSCEGMNVWSDWGYFATIFDGIFLPDN